MGGKKVERDYPRTPDFLLSCLLSAASVFFFFFPPSSEHWAVKLALRMVNEDNDISSWESRRLPLGVDWARGRGGGWRGITGWRRRSPRACSNLCSASGFGRMRGGEPPLRWSMLVLERTSCRRREEGNVFKYANTRMALDSFEKGSPVENIEEKRKIDGAGGKVVKEGLEPVE